MKKTIHFILDHDTTEKFFLFLILFELVLCLLDPETSSYAAFKIFFKYFEFFVIAIFTLEYILRVFTIDKVKNIFKPLLMIDLLTLVPVTGLVFIVAMFSSSIFFFAAEHSNRLLAMKKMPLSSLWSVIAFGIYCYDGTLPIAAIEKFISSFSYSFGFVLQIAVVVLILALLSEPLIRKYKELKLKRMTIRAELFVA